MHRSLSHYNDDMIELRNTVSIWSSRSCEAVKWKLGGMGRLTRFLKMYLCDARRLLSDTIIIMIPTCFSYNTAKYYLLCLRVQI